MKSFLLLALFCGTFHQAYTVSVACDACNSAYGTDCNSIKDYITCLTAATGTGCETVHTKMSTANTDAGTNNCALTDTCQCQVGYFKTDLSAGDAVKCTALKSELKCMFDTTGNSCDVNINATTAYETVKTAAEGISKCFTGTACECEATSMKSANTDCNAYKDALTCLFASHVTDATTTPCDGGNFTVFVNAIKQSGLTYSNCLTSVCECQASYYSSDLSTNSLKCKAVTDFETCTVNKTASEMSCDGSSNLTVVQTFMNAVKDAACDGARVNHVPILVAVVMLMSWTLK